MHPLNFPDIHAALDDIVIKLIEMAYCRQCGTRNSRERVEIQPVKASRNHEANATDESTFKRIFHCVQSPQVLRINSLE